jgi:hypothetical protein
MHKDNVLNDIGRSTRWAIPATLLVWGFCFNTNASGDDFNLLLNATATPFQGFRCDPSQLRADSLLVAVQNGAPGQGLYLRPHHREKNAASADVDNVCEYDVFYKDGREIDLLISDEPAMYSVAYAQAFPRRRSVVWCFSREKHKMRAGQNDKLERQTEKVTLLCGGIVGGKLIQAKKVVEGKGPGKRDNGKVAADTYAAWVTAVDVNLQNPSGYMVSWMRDSTFQFLNLSNEGRPGTDGAYQSRFTMDKNGFHVEKKIAKLKQQDSGFSVTVTGN